MFLRGAQRRRGGSIPFIEQIKGVHGCAINFLGVGQNALLRLQALVFTGLQFGVFDLAFLEGPEIEQTEAILLVALQFFDAIGNVLPPGKRLGDRFKRRSGKSVEQTEPGGSIEGEQGFILRVDGREVRSKLAQHRNRCRLIVDEDASLAAAGNLAPQDDGLIFPVDAVGLQYLGHGFPGAGLDFEYGGDHGLVGSGANDFAGSFFAEKESQSIDEDRFTRAGFAGQQVKPSRELYRQIVNDCVVFEPQFDQHKPSWKEEVVRRIA